MNSKALLSAIVSSVALFAMPAAAETFDGPYAGVQSGWSRAEISDATSTGAALDSEAARDAFVLGGYLGYNYRATDNIVIGAEAGFSGAFEDDVRALSASRPLTIDPRYSFDVTARAGYLVDDKTLAYVRGGYANERVRIELATANGTLRDTDNLDGWLVGGGIERSLTDHLSTRLEYRYTDYGNNGGGYDQHQALVGISYNF